MASDLPGIADVVGDAGILVEPGCANRLAEALRGLREKGALRDRLSARARLRAESFRWEETARSYATLIEQLLESEPARLAVLRAAWTRE